MCNYFTKYTFFVHIIENRIQFHVKYPCHHIYTYKLLRYDKVASNHVNLTARVFNIKLNSVFDDMYKKGIFGKVVAHIRIPEFQERGLPHAHILIISEGQYKLTSTDDYDNIVRAEIPNPITQPRIYNILTNFMISLAKLSIS